MDQDRALALCQSYLDTNEPEPSSMMTIGAYETKLFWYFRWNSREAVETRGARGYRKTPWITIEKSTATIRMLVDGRPPPVTRPAWVSPATLEGARWIAQASLDATSQRPYVLADEIREGARAWVFYWQGADGQMTVGGGPILVDKRTGETRQLRINESIEAVLAKT